MIILTSVGIAAALLFHARVPQPLNAATFSPVFALILTLVVTRDTVTLVETPDTVTAGSAGTHLVHENDSDRQP